ncbi:MAG TPA: hypothetical protein DCE42_10855 [Myxococcales bacterium]|nr:hypothetical protein [Deltaproteobacteria bacterium]MBU54756.1 hypothetical protein [Deltaproteobacteria bacterium]HAA55246.1 hypothetical protein [Myxococcales bacterium]|tara:strand:+ start:3642 stop:4514 length:873 start_codon:yes stop_codon:yes gene_type:complete
MKQTNQLTVMVLPKYDVRKEFIESLSTYVRHCLQQSKVMIVHDAEDGLESFLSHFQGQSSSSSPYSYTDAYQTFEEVGSKHPKKTKAKRETFELQLETTMVMLCLAANKRLTLALSRQDIPALGLSGADLKSMTSSFLNMERLGRIGGPPEIDFQAFEPLLDGGYVPVLSPICVDKKNRFLWVQPSSIAQSLATSTTGATLEVVWQEPIEQRPEQQKVTSKEIVQWMRQGTLPKRLIPLLQASLVAIGSGVNTVRVGSLEELETDSAIQIVKQKQPAKHTLEEPQLNAYS